MTQTTTNTAAPVTTTVDGAVGAFGKMTLPNVVAQRFLTKENPVLLSELPEQWHKPLFGKRLQVKAAEEILELLAPEMLAGIASGDRNVDAIETERRASLALIKEGRFPIGWHVEGEGNLTQALIAWGQWAVTQLRAGNKIGLIKSLGGAAGKGGQKLRHVDVLQMLRDTPLRHGGAINGISVGKATLGGLALVCCALTSRRVQDCIKQALEKQAEYGEDEGEDGWPQFFTPAMAYGQLSEFAANNVERFTAHLTVSFRRNQLTPELDVIAAPFGMKAYVIAQDLAEGTCHIPHDQLKNSSIGQGARATWLVDGNVVSLCGAGSKPEKFLNRQKLLTGNGAVLLQRQGSKLRVQVD